MRDTHYNVPREKVNRVSAVYRPLENGKIELFRKPEFREPTFGRGIAGLNGTAGDYFKFTQMLLNGGEYNGVRILSRKTVELMTANHVPAGAPGQLNPGVSYGLGVSTVVDVAASGNLGSKGVFGWGGYASTYVIMDPVEKLVAILMVQYQPTNFPLWTQFQTLVYQSIVD